jgi:hypothetical protein
MYTSPDFFLGTKETLSHSKNSCWFMSSLFMPKIQQNRPTSKVMPGCSLTPLHRPTISEEKQQ